jgi:TolB protein
MSASRRALFAVVTAAALLTAACGNNLTAAPPSTGAEPSGRPGAPTASATAPAGAPEPTHGDAPPASYTLYYGDYGDGGKLYRGAEPVRNVDAYTANVSPDGTRIAFVDNGVVKVADRNGGGAQAVLSGVPIVGYEPVWSADSKRLLVGKGEQGVELGIVTVATKAYTRLAHQPDSVIHPLWSGDGKRIVYATGTCQLGTANADGGNARLVPNYGKSGGRRSCDPYSVSADGTLVAVAQRTGDTPDGDIGRDSLANAIVDTRTGDNVTLPVTGTINAIVFLPDGKILVRTSGKLTLLNADRTVNSQTTEAASVKNYRLISYVAP